MCTVSWLPGPGGYLLCFNRDENRARSPALPPTLRADGGLEIIAPTDADGGGTWIGVNSAGVTICLANLYDSPNPSPANPISRGLLVLGLLGQRQLDSVEASLAAFETGRYRPFSLIGMEPDRPARIWRWDGARLTSRAQPEAGLLITSSAVDQPRAESARRQLFEELYSSHWLSAASLVALHQSHRPERGGRSVCMHRPDAHTVSLTRVEVTTDTISMAYSAGSPCLHPLGTPLMTLRQSLRARS
ncbi:MAG: NRDE family protein [Gemmatimonadota bacterium]